MSRPHRILAAGALYHVMARGTAKMAIYCDDDDRHRFLTVLGTVVERHGIECHAYCLMSNHYHLIISTPEPNLSTAIHYLNSVYAQWWNKRHKRVGHVMGGRFKAQVMQRDGYFLEACRYVVLNAVRAGLVKNVEDWVWSSYAATAGLAPCPQWLTTSSILGARTSAMRQEYRAFIAAGVPESDVAVMIRSRLPIVGSEEFAASHRDLIEQADPTEVTRRDRSVGRPTLTDLFKGVRSRRERDVQIRQARDRYCYRLSEIAAHVSLHYGSVSRIVCAADTVRRGETVRSPDKKPT